MSKHTLKITHGTSRARDTYGYNTVTVTDEAGRKFKCMGGGYDMTGTVFGEWLADTHQTELRAWAAALGATADENGRTPVPDHYGAFLVPASKHVPLASRVLLDGACGIESMLRIAKALGLKLERTYKPSGPSRGETTGWLVEE